MLNKIKDLLIGHPLPTQQLYQKRLNKIRALAAFSPDALSSIAYANQEIYLGLVVAGSAGLSLTTPIGLAIAGLLIIVAISYFQTIHGYPSGGGSYVVARENLGTMAGLIAAAALLIDYVLASAVSLTAGIAAIASAFPDLWPYRVHLAILALVVITLLNLRGLRETGTIMAIPVYLFLICYFPLLAYGAVRLWLQGGIPFDEVAPPAQQPLTSFLVLHTFAAGCTALTGIEAISNGVPAFKYPEARNAGRTLIVMAILMCVLFVGSVGLTQSLGVVAGAEETILSALARRLLGPGPFYLLVQASTMLILAVAANTSFAGFPRVAALLAFDKFLPRPLVNLGDRLVYTNGILLLALVSGVLIVVFGGDTHLLIPLFAVGAFLAFTLSQLGMVAHWWRLGDKGWAPKAILNGAGAVATGMALGVIAFSKFLEGAWITILMISLVVILFLHIRDHYLEVGRELSLRGLPASLKPTPLLRIVVPVSGVHRGILDAITFSRSISRNVTGLYVEIEPGAGKRIRKDWEGRFPEVPLVVVPSPYRSVIGPLLDFLDEIDQKSNDGQLAAVVIPEFIPAKWWHVLLHNQTAWMIKAALIYRRRQLGYQRVIIDIPYHLKK